MTTRHVDVRLQDWAPTNTLHKGAWVSAATHLSRDCACSFAAVCVCVCVWQQGRGGCQVCVGGPQVSAPARDDRLDAVLQYIQELIKEPDMSAFTLLRRIYVSASASSLLCGLGPTAPPRRHVL